MDRCEKCGIAGTVREDEDGRPIAVLTDPTGRERFLWSIPDDPKTGELVERIRLVNTPCGQTGCSRGAHYEAGVVVFKGEG